MPRYRVVPYRQGSRSASSLAQALGGLCLKVDGASRYRPRPDDIIINWGNTNTTLPGIKNTAGRVKGASNKLLFFRNMQANAPDVIPPFWETRDAIPDAEFPIVCRTVLAGHSGEGIVIAANRAALVNAPLYTKYIKKQDEYRIHVGRDHATRLAQDDTCTILSIQRKAKREGFEGANFQIRNHQNGFVYVRNNVRPPASVLAVAQTALLNSGLDFGAVDVIYTARQERAYVLEINTAPGLEGQTITDYANFFRGVR